MIVFIARQRGRTLYFHFDGTHPQLKIPVAARHLVLCNSVPRPRCKAANELQLFVSALRSENASCPVQATDMLTEAANSFFEENGAAIPFSNLCNEANRMVIGLGFVKRLEEAQLKLRIQVGSQTRTLRSPYFLIQRQGAIGCWRNGGTPLLGCYQAPNTISFTRGPNKPSDRTSFDQLFRGSAHAYSAHPAARAVIDTFLKVKLPTTRTTSQHPTRQEPQISISKRQREYRMPQDILHYSSVSRKGDYQHHDPHISNRALSRMPAFVQLTP